MLRMRGLRNVKQYAPLFLVCTGVLSVISLQRLYYAERLDYEGDSHRLRGSGGGNASGRPNCSGAFEWGQAGADARAAIKAWRPPATYSDAELDALLDDCGAFDAAFPLSERANSDGEKAFPLAYAFLIHNNGEQVIRLLQLLYQPQNVFCIHVDLKAATVIQSVVRKLAACHRRNIMLPDERYRIYWGHIGVLDAYVSCLRAMVRSASRWRYVQFLAANDAPLRCNWEMVEIFKLWRGANDAELIDDKPGRHRTAKAVAFEQVPAGWKNAKGKMFRGKAVTGGQAYFFDTRVEKGPPPDSIAMYKGSVAQVLSHEFVQWMLRAPAALALRDYLVDAISPEESFTSTLLHNELLRAPGHFPGYCLQHYHKQHLIKPWISRYTVWPEQTSSSRQCLGVYVRGSCLFGVDALPALAARRELFAHKVDAVGHEPATFACLAEHIGGRQMIHESERRLSESDTRYYANLPAARYAQWLRNGGENDTDATFDCGQGMDNTA